MLRAARLRDGPAATRLTRMPRVPRSRARKRDTDCSADFATPIQSYTGNARVLSKSKPTTEPPPSMSGSAATASAFSEYADTWNATATSSHGASRNPPPRHEGGAYAIEWTTPSSRPPTRSASASRSSRLLTSSSTMSTSVGSRRAARRVMLMTRPNELSTTSAPCSCAMRATGNASDASLVIPVTRMRLPSSSMTSPQSLRVEVSERRIGVTAVRLMLPLRRQSFERGRERAARLGRGDHVVDVAAFGRDVRVEKPLLVLAGQRALFLGASSRIRDCVELPSMEDADRGLRAHHRDLGGGPGNAPVGSEPARVHHDVGTPVRLAQDHTHAGYARSGVRVEQLGAVADDAAPFEVASRQVPARVDERDHGDVETVAPLHEARGLLRG